MARAPPGARGGPRGEGCRNSAEVRCGGAAPAFVAREGRDSRTVLHAGELGVVITRAERDSPHGYGQVIGFAAATGEPRFREPLLKSGDAVDAASDVDLALSFDRLFVTYRLATGPSRVLARNARTGAELWSVLPPAVGTGISAIYAGADRLFLRVDDALLVLDARSGASVGTIH